MLLRLHLEQSIVRTRAAYGAVGEPGLLVPMAVGFVDLVGFTPRAHALEPAQLADLVARFESSAHDLVTDLGGRLVKLIGDEVMFVAVEAATGCDIAVALLQGFGTDPALTPRGGLAYGDVLARAGDFFGPTVNLAARLAEQAVPGEVLATPAVAEAAPHHRVEPAGRRLLKGFPAPVAVVSLAAPAHDD
jgi:adenylate cyclase